MPNVKKQKGLLLLSKEKIDSYIPSHPQIASLPFQTNIIRSMEVLDKNALNVLIKTFVQNNRLVDVTFSLIIGESLLFEKVITSDTSKQQVATPPQVTGQPSQPRAAGAVVPPQQTQTPHAPHSSTETQKVIPPKSSKEVAEDENNIIEKFIETVPFEEVLTKVIRTPRETRVIVANKDLIVSLQEAFELQGIAIDSVVPITALGVGSTSENNLSMESAQLYLSKIDMQKVQTMLVDEKKDLGQQTGPVSLGMPQKESEKKRLYIMMGIFGILIIVLIVVYLRMVNENTQPPVQNQPIITQPSAPSATPTTQPSIDPIASSTAEMKAALPITLNISSQRASLSAQLIASIRSAGYQSVSSSQGSITASPFVIFSSGVPKDSREEIVLLLQSFDASVSAQENTVEEPVVIVNF